MDIIYQHGRAAAADVRAALPDPPSYSSVRALLTILETKGHVKHIKDGPRYVYLPTHPRANAAKTALRSVMRTFFGGSVEQTVATLLSVSEAPLSAVELSRLSALINNAKDDVKEDSQ